MEFKKEYVKSMKLAAYLMFAVFRILEVRKDRFKINRKDGDINVTC